MGTGRGGVSGMLFHGERILEQLRQLLEDRGVGGHQARAGGDGVSNVLALGIIPLPIDLEIIGYPGCNLLVAPDTTVLLAVTAHEASWTLVVPHENALSGVEFFCQAFAFDPGANLAGLIATNAGRSRLGN